MMYCDYFLLYKDGLDDFFSFWRDLEFKYSLLGVEKRVEDLFSLILSLRKEKDG